MGRRRDLESHGIPTPAGVATVVERIRQLGLEVALHKSEAMCFHGPRNAPPSVGFPNHGDSIVIVDSTPMCPPHSGVESTMKYLGLVFDNRWNFVEHFRRLAPRLQRAGAALKRLLPNLGGPNAPCRRLHAGVVRSMAFYGAPVWAHSLRRGPTRHLRASQWVMAIRLVQGYRTVSGEAASLLAGLSPWDRARVGVARGGRRGGVPPRPDLEKRFTYLRVEYYSPLSPVNVTFNANTSILYFNILFPFMDLAYGVLGYSLKISQSRMWSTWRKSLRKSKGVQSKHSRTSLAKSGTCGTY